MLTTALLFLVSFWLWVGTLCDGLRKRGARCEKSKEGPLFSVQKNVAKAVFSI